jgi:hypothetical protein
LSTPPSRRPNRAEAWIFPFPVPPLMYDALICR